MSLQPMVRQVESMLEDISEGSIDSIDSQTDFVETAEIMGHTYLPSGLVIVSEGSAPRPSQAIPRPEDFSLTMVSMTAKLLA